MAEPVYSVELGEKRTGHEDLAYNILTAALRIAIISIHLHRGCLSVWDLRFPWPT